MATTPPSWATRLIERVCAEENVETPPVVTWHRSRRNAESSGQAGRDRVHITAGSDARDRRYTLLHELAHYVLSVRVRDTNHSEAFWRLTFELCARHGVPHRYAARSAELYRPGSAKVAASYRRSRRAT